MKDKSAQKFAADKFSENDDLSFATRMADEMAQLESEALSRLQKSREACAKVFLT